MSQTAEGPVHIVTRGINLKSVASTTIVPSNRNSRKFIVHKIWITVASGTGVTVGATVRASSVGNSGSAGDVAGSVTMTNLGIDQLTDMALASPQKAWSLATGAGSITLDVTSGATATTMTGDVHVIGYYA